MISELLPFWKRRSTLVAFLAFLGFFNVHILRINLNEGLVAMASSSDTKPNEFNWSPELRAVIISSFFYGYVSTQLIGGVLGAKLGGVKLVGYGVLNSAVVTILTPMVAKSSGYPIVVLRIVQGMFEGVVYPGMLTVWSKWAPPAERTRLVSFAFSGGFLGVVVGHPLCRWLAEKYGWSSIFFLPGCVAIIWCSIWFTYVAESPMEDKRITNVELDHIVDSIGPILNTKTSFLSYPWKDMIASMPVWSIACVHFCENWGFHMVFAQLPNYMHDVLKFDAQKRSLITVVSFLVLTVTLQFNGLFADWLRNNKILTTTHVRKVFNCGSLVCQAVFVFLLAKSSDNESGSIICLTVTICLSAFAWAGFSVNPLDIAPQYAGIVMGISNTIAATSGIVSPVLADCIVQNKSAEEWQYVFLISSGIYLFGAIFYAIFASGEQQPWA